MKPKSAKAKGRRLQHYIRDVLLRMFPSLTDDDVRVAIMGERGVDVQLSQAARSVWPFSIESKNTERLNVWEAIAQSERNCQPGTTPMVVFRRNRSRAYAIVPFEELVAKFAPETEPPDDSPVSELSGRALAERGPE